MRFLSLRCLILGMMILAHMAIDNPFFSYRFFSYSRLHAENALKQSEKQSEKQYWPQWRGPNNDGISSEKNLPAEFSNKNNLLWSIDLPGMGSSTPIVWEDKIFITYQKGTELVLACYSTLGKPLWNQPMGQTDIGKVRQDEGNAASATCSTDGKHVYAFVGNGELGCFTLDGKKVWQFNTQKRYGKFNIQFGMHSTPILYQDGLYLQLLYTGGAHVIALEKNTGKQIWKVERTSDGRAECEHSYASAMIWQNGKDAVLISHGNDYAIGHDLKDGKELWRVGDLNPKKGYNPTLRFVSTPLATSELIIIPTAKNGPVVALDPSARGKIGIGSKFEKWRIAHGTPDVPCPLLYNGLVYLCKENGNLLCLDAKTGQLYYDQRTHGGRYRASPVLADGKIFLTCRDGTITVVKPGKEFERLAENRLNDDFTASPAFANGQMILHGFKKLYAIGYKKQ